MYNFYQVLKRSLIGVSGCCVALSILFLVQIIVQKSEIKAIEQLEDQTKEKMTAVDTDNKILSDNVDQLVADMQYFMQEYKRIGQEEENAAKRYAALETEYAMKMYLDSVMAEVDKECGNQFCIERYFKIGKRELLEIIEETGASSKLEAKFPNADKWGCLLPVGEEIWVQYDVNTSKNDLPTGLVIQNPSIDFGYECARAGMYLFDIKEIYPSSEVEEVRLDWGNMRYLRYEDKGFIYYYLAISEYGDTAILYIMPKT